MQSNATPDAATGGGFTLSVGVTPRSVFLQWALLGREGERVLADLATHTRINTIELADGDRTVLDLFAPYKDRLSKKIAIGVVSHRNLQVERADEVAELTRAALRTIGPENLILSSDCGFGRQGANRAIAFYKAVAIVQGANIVRRELGLEERYVPAADPRFQADLLGERRSALSTA